MARSWQYPRWRRIVVQVILWVILGGTLAVAQLVVRHRRMVGSVELADARTVDLPGGVVAGVRLPKGWLVEHDPAEHANDRDTTVREFRAIEPAGGVGGTPDPDDAEFGRELVIRFQSVPTVLPPREQMDRSGLLAHTIELPGDGPMPVAGADGWWVSFGRPVDGPPGRRAISQPAYAAMGVVPAGPRSPTPVAVAVELDCLPGDTDLRGDQDLLQRVAGAITVERDRAPAVPTIHVVEPTR